MTPQQISDLKTLQASSGERDLQRAADWANDASRSGSVTGTTAPNLVGKFSQFDQVRITQLRALATAAGITRNDLNSAATVGAKLDTWFSALTAAQKQNLTLGIIKYLLGSLAETWADSQAADTVDTGSQPIYGPSWAAQHGFATVTRDMIEEALRQ